MYFYRDFSFAAAFIGLIYYIEFQLPDIDALNNVQLQVPYKFLRVMAS